MSIAHSWCRQVLVIPLAKVGPSDSSFASACASIRTFSAAVKRKGAGMTGARRICGKIIATAFGKLTCGARERGTPCPVADSSVLSRLCTSRSAAGQSATTVHYGSQPIRPVHRVQFGIHFTEKTLDFSPLVGAGLLLQSAQQMMLLRQELRNTRHQRRGFMILEHWSTSDVLHLRF